MEDIARRLSVSKGTVSKALSGATDISETLRKSILETAVEMGYARIQRSDGRRLCVLVTNMAYQYPGDFGYDLIMGFRKLAEPGGFRVDVVELTDDLQQQYSYDAFMLKNDYLSEKDFKGSRRYLTADGTIANGAIVRIKEVKVGDVTLKNIEAYVVNSQKAPLLLGQSVLDRFGTITIDNEHSIMTIEYSPRD